ncbi:hypothetical protein ABTX35_03570 [Streptomyces sp. NPDC096080]|uniref:hypothetical protein n=1 Tax=Streptomyces sp. NPDC096080 TaxID=3156693 RepID=UPI003330F187
MAASIPCPGVCNTALRRAERSGAGQDMPVVWGEPVHCDGCVDRARRHLTELPELLAAVSLEPVYGQRGVPTASTTSAPTDTTPWPGQAARLLIDHIVGGLGEMAADVAFHRRLRERPVRPTGQREGIWASGTVKLLSAHIVWLLQEHPCATETHEPGRLGRVLVPSGNPAAQIAAWHRAATRFTRRDTAPEAKRFAPCKRCGGPWLAESRDLRLVDDSPYIECQDPQCGLLLTHAEYAHYVKELAATELAARRTPVHPDGAPGETAA